MTITMICYGCGADVLVSITLKHPPARDTIFCLGCTKLNAAKAAYAAQQQKKRQFAQMYVGGLPKMAYSRHPGRTIPYQTYAGQTQTSPTTQCSFTWDMPRMAYAVQCQYQPNFIEFIKAKIPASDRAWDPTTKTWYIKDDWFDIMFELASQLWPNSVSTITREAAEKAWKEQEEARSALMKAQREAVLGPLESALLEFCNICDVDALRKARNAMAITLHPDKGGDANKMAKLNASWFVVESELKKRSEMK